MKIKGYQNTDFEEPDNCMKINMIYEKADELLKTHDLYEKMPPFETTAHEQITPEDPSRIPTASPQSVP